MNNDKFINSAGRIFYGMHFYPGVAEYSEPGKNSFRIYLNENTLRKMDASFAAKPIFVEHVEEVNSNIDQLKKEADGWVIESFFNSIDGKHWVKFIVVSKKAEEAISNGFRLSNAYIPQLSGEGGEWNGITYQNEVIDGEYEHLAIVQDPRYDESVIMTPEEYKIYNENLENELKRIANSKQKENIMNKLKFWNKKAVDNSIDFENLCITLPKCGKDFTIAKLVNAMDEMEEKKKENMADPSAMVKMHDGKMCNVGELVEKYKNLSEEHQELKDCMKNDDEMESELEMGEEPVEVHEDDAAMQNEEDDDEMKKKEESEKEEVKKDSKMKNKIKKNSRIIESKNRAYFETLKNAHLYQNSEPLNNYDSAISQVERGMQRYGQ